MLPYYFLIGLCVLGEPILKRSPQHRQVFLLVTGISFYLFASLRYVVGFDYRFYEDVFQWISQSNYSEMFASRTIEPGYSVLNRAISYIGGDYRTFLLVFHLLFLLLVFVWIDRFSPAPWLSVYLFITLQYFALSMNFLRQAFAAAIILWTYPFMKSNRFLPCIPIILLAATFHRTVLIMLPLCFLLTRKPSRLHYGIVALIAAVSYLFMDSVIEFVVKFAPKYQHYLSEQYWQGNSAIYLLLPVGCFLFSLPLFRQTYHRPSDSPVLANVMFYAPLMQIFITKHFILERFSIYTAFFSLLALPEALNAPSTIPRKIRKAILLIGCIGYFLFAANKNFHGVYPYRGIWDKALC